MTIHFLRRGTHGLLDCNLPTLQWRYSLAANDRHAIAYRIMQACGVPLTQETIARFVQDHAALMQRPEWTITEDDVARWAAQGDER